MAESVLSEAAGARQRVPRALPVLTAEPDASAADIVLALDGDDLGNRPRGPRRRSYPAARARSKSFTPGATFRDPVATSTCFLPRKQRDYPAKPIRRLKGSNENKLLAVDRLVVASGDPLARRPKKTRTRQRRRSGRLARRSRRQNVDILGEARSRDRGVPRLRGRPEGLRMARLRPLGRRAALVSPGSTVGSHHPVAASLAVRPPLRPRARRAGCPGRICFVGCSTKTASNVPTARGGCDCARWCWTPCGAEDRSRAARRTPTREPA